MSSADLLRAVNINKRYGGVCALQDAGVSVTAGEIHALVGENGAGKSTLAKIIAGAVRADHGSIFFNGQPVSITHSLCAQRLGIAIIFQELDLFPHLTIAENMVIGNVRCEQNQFVRHKRVNNFCEPFLQQVGVTHHPRTPLYTLSISQMQLVAIARALSAEAKLILMDEPTSSLSEDATERLFHLVSLLKEGGVSTIFVSHKMKEIFRICDRITVLRDGSTIGTRVTRETDHREIIAMMVGRELKVTPDRKHRPTQEVELSVSQLGTNKISNISFQLRRGEVLGIAGLVGSGRSELGAALFGIDHVKHGVIQLKGRQVRLLSPQQAIRSRLGLLPEDRKLLGLMMGMSVLDNATMAVLENIRGWILLKRTRQVEMMTGVLLRTRLKVASGDAPVNSLSGGNQQKVLLAKWLLTDPNVLFLDEPTRGIDVAAKQEIYEMIDELADQGKAIIFVSSELPELFQCCDRIMVLREGQNAGVVEVFAATAEMIMSLATGAGGWPQ